jgi:uncharacterized protein YecA (UPF0149 family)
VPTGDEQRIGPLEGLVFAAELVLTLDEEERRELDGLRSARDIGSVSTPADALPSLEASFGGGEVGRNDPCPCGSGQKFKRCHGR